MSKKEFLEKLNKELRKIKIDEREKVIEFYNNYIDEAIDDKNTEEKVIEKMGSISQIVNKIKSEYNVRKLNEEPHIFNLLKAIISIFKRISLLESIQVSISVIFKLIMIFIVSLTLLISGIVVSVFGSTTSLILLYSSIIVQNFTPATSNLALFIVSIFIFLLIVPTIICIILFSIYFIIKMGYTLVKKYKNKIERALIVFDLCILILFISILYLKIIGSINFIPSSSLIFLEAISMIIIGLTGLVIYALIIFSKYINKRVAKSFDKILIKLEGEKV